MVYLHFAPLGYVMKHPNTISSLRNHNILSWAEKSPKDLKFHHGPQEDRLQIAFEMGFKDFVNQVVYAFSTEDRYAEYSSHNPQNHHAHHQTRHQNIELNESNTFDDPNSNAGVSEILLAWRHIETWTQENHSDLSATLSDPVTRIDIQKAEEDLGVQLPASVRASFRVHDGQEGLESLLGSGGLFFGMRLMDLNDVVSSTKHWRLVAERMELDAKVRENRIAREALISPTGSSLSLDKNRSTVSLNETNKGYGHVTTDENSIDPELEGKLSSKTSIQETKQLPRQRSIPVGAIKTVYANANWIPLVSDGSGNHIGVDLDPDVEGVLGQVIIFGREFDTKFVLAPTWGDFLLSFVNELENGNYLIHQDVDDVFGGDGELVFFDKQINREVPYLSYLTHKVLAYWRSQHPQPPRSQPRPRPETQFKPTQKKTPVSHVKKEERVISHDITTTKEQDLKEDKELAKKSEEDLAKVQSGNSQKDSVVDADVSQDIVEETLSNDFKEVSI